MDQKMKFIIIGLIGFSVICLFLFLQSASHQQILLRENKDLKAENATFIKKASKLENDLKENQSKIDSLRAERDRGAEELKNLQSQLDLLSKTRDELLERLKKQASLQAAAASQQQITAPENNDAYWGQVLKSKADLEMRLSNIREELGKLQISNESLQREKSALEIDVNSLRNERKDLLRQIDYNQKLLDSISQDVVREKNDKIAIQDNLKAIRAQNDLLSRQLKSLNSRRENLDKKVQSLTEGKSTVAKRLNEMETMLNSKIAQIDSLKNELEAIKSGKPDAVLEKRKESVELPAIVVRSSSAAKDKAQAAVSGGKVLAVNAESKFVVIDLGASAGVRVGDTFGVWRAGKSIGSIVVIQARENISACDIKRASPALKVGDIIK